MKKIILRALIALFVFLSSCKHVEPQDKPISCEHIDSISLSYLANTCSIFRLDTAIMYSGVGYKMGCKSSIGIYRRLVIQRYIQVVSEVRIDSLNQLDRVDLFGEISESAVVGDSMVKRFGAYQVPLLKRGDRTLHGGK